MAWDTALCSSNLRGFPCRTTMSGLFGVGAVHRDAVMTVRGSTQPVLVNAGDLRWCGVWPPTAYLRRCSHQRMRTSCGQCHAVTSWSSPAAKTCHIVTSWSHGHMVTLSRSDILE
jgi:hypothetical protein